MNKDTANISSPGSRSLLRNSTAMFVRALVAVLVGIYTSRVVLEVLGVTNYGIYGLVAGFIGLAAFLNTSMAGATSRFLTFELGREHLEQLAGTFAAARALHFAIAAAVVVLGETVGLWAVNCWLNIPPESLVSANVVYQLAILSTAVSITQVPYTAILMSRERLTLYAYVEIAAVVVRLLAVWGLVIVPGNKLIWYAIQIAVINIAIAAFYRMYCRRRFAECRAGMSYRADAVKPMIRFCLVDLYGNGCVTVRQEGTNLILNLFFGVAINAAASLAGTVIMAINSLTNSVLAAFRPRIVKSFARGDIAGFNAMINKGMLLNGLLFMTIAIPVFVEAPALFRLWLVEVPDWSVTFCRTILIGAVILLFNAYIVAGVHATGRIARISFIGGTLYLLSLPVICLLLQFGYRPDIAYIVVAADNLVILICTIVMLKQQVEGFSAIRIPATIAVTAICSAPACAGCYLIASMMDEGFARLLLTGAVSVCLVGVPACMYYQRLKR